MTCFIQWRRDTLVWGITLIFFNLKVLFIVKKLKKMFFYFILDVIEGDNNGFLTGLRAVLTFPPYVRLSLCFLFLSLAIAVWAYLYVLLQFLFPNIGFDRMHVLWNRYDQGFFLMIMRPFFFFKWFYLKYRKTSCNISEKLKYLTIY